MIRFLSLSAMILLLAFSTGCGGEGGNVPPPNYGSEDGLKIAEFVSMFNEYKADAAKFKKSFAGNAPSNWKDYGKTSYEVVPGSPKVNGESATASITIHNESNYEVIATKEWTFTKVGAEWKIKDAPLK